MKLRKTELTGFNKTDKFEPLLSCLKTLIETSEELKVKSIYTLEISPIEKNNLFEEKTSTDYIMYLIEDQLSNPFIERYIRVNCKNQFYIGFRIARMQFESSFKIHWEALRNMCLLRNFSNKNYSDFKFSFFEVRLKDFFEYPEGNRRKGKIITNKKLLESYLVKFLNLNFYNDFLKVVEMYFKLKV